MPTIKPALGRIVHYYWNGVNGRAFAAIICDVLAERRVDLTVIDKDGSMYPARNIRLIQPGECRPDIRFCEFPPHDIEQVADAKGNACTGEPVMPHGMKPDPANATVAESERSKESREITSHKVDELNRKIDIQAKPDGHAYTVTPNGCFRLVINDTIFFQRGPLDRSGPNGLTEEVLLAILLDRIYCRRDLSLLRNRKALRHLANAMQWLSVNRGPNKEAPNA